ncbi:hypothetical protein [Dictyobacter formicarum]|uniref:Uncharacterized protein n=1 Tax=Dictyobacter formicarum TaxID=2778368 RepID=A0ABQ3VBG6_9CHLR|nr:hypothetical protein [Dictyobacter formicarum]GHO83130.1 hypothetical protein KSZ_11360 [Dictyobacter formicarum]
MSERPIFRKSAIERYQQKHEQGVLLRVSYPPALIFFWIFLLALVGAGGFALSIQVPVVIQGQGVVIEQKISEQNETATVAKLFIAPNQRTHLHTGQPAVISIGSPPINVTGVVEHVDTNIISPDEARSRFKLQGGLAQVVIGPSTIVTISIGSTASARLYAGSLCNAQIQTGSQSVFSLLPGVNQLLEKLKV